MSSKEESMADSCDRALRTASVSKPCLTLGCGLPLWWPHFCVREVFRAGLPH